MTRERYCRETGQSIVEYAGMMVLSTLLVAGLLGGAHQFMPAVFNALSQNNETAFSEDDPAPAAAQSPAPSPAPSPSPSPTPSPSPAPTPSPAPAPAPAPTPSGCHGNGAKSCD
ncbi:MAG: hypothetical protein K0Q50_562 [Vampirovibrio sp.]|nr:hypothetical protein [Vampirovibrio sp.]